jgi:hypothetical protein
MAPPSTIRVSAEKPTMHNSYKMHTSPRCGARTRKGTPCRAPAVRGKRRCRMHGGAVGSGAPKGNRNAVKHGFYIREAIEERSRIKKLIRESEELLDSLG